MAVEKPPTNYTVIWVYDTYGYYMVGCEEFEYLSDAEDQYQSLADDRCHRKVWLIAGRILKSKD